MTIAGSYIMASLAPSSRTLYANSMGRLQQFALSVADVQTWFPASVSLICLFIAHLLDSGLAPATVWSTLSGIAFFHKLFRVADPTGDFLVKRLMLGASKVHPACDDIGCQLPSQFYMYCAIPPIISHEVLMQLVWFALCSFSCSMHFYALAR